MLEVATDLLVEREMVSPDGAQVSLHLRSDNVASLASVAEALEKPVADYLAEFHGYSLQAVSTLNRTAGVSFTRLPDSRQLGAIRFTREAPAESGTQRPSGGENRQVEEFDAQVCFYPDAWALESGTVLIEVMLRKPPTDTERRSWFVKVQMLLDQSAEGEWAVRDHSITGRGR